MFIVEAVRGSAEGPEPRNYESFLRRRIDDVAEAKERLGWKGERRTTIEFPWAGKQVIIISG